MKKENPRTMRWQGGIFMLIGAAFLVYGTHPIASESVAEWSRILVVSIGIPLAVVNIGIVLWALGTILQKLDEIKNSQINKG